jgi:hypothetical protein
MLEGHIAGTAVAFSAPMVSIMLSLPLSVNAEFGRLDTTTNSIIEELRTLRSAASFVATWRDSEGLIIFQSWRERLPEAWKLTKAFARFAHHFRARSQIEFAAAKTIIQNANVRCMTLSAYRKG